MTQLKLDHVVHYVNCVNDAVKTFQESGFHAVKGGSHKDWGTCNGLSYFGLSYIEWLGIEDTEKLEKTTLNNPVFQDAKRLLPSHPVLHKLAIRTTDIEAVDALLKLQGFQTSGPVANSRLDARGSRINWKMLTIDGSFDGLPHPFFIQWGKTDDERIQSLESSGVISTHDRGPFRISAVILSVRKPEEARRFWHETFKIPLGKDFMWPNSLNLSGVYLQFILGEENRPVDVILSSSEHMEKTDLVIEQGHYTLIGK
ncbi:VOC family protein [Salisediminibacterium beveridgei]|uniref:Glyoxalase-like domain-containing protein n=1 Tax=Salisediminibacterium beveridgei TaxID=632773 RepID=A0A1D7QVP1_9BACI|nr:VOC family protein [Salisediminibacterium beveridgei]AOM83082.1 hypothetical protein BBEV_1721 [Salisediminibacterium beveridgei]